MQYRNPRRVLTYPGYLKSWWMIAHPGTKDAYVESYLSDNRYHMYNAPWLLYGNTRIIESHRTLVNKYNLEIC